MANEKSEEDFTKEGVLEELIQDGRVPINFGAMIEGSDDNEKISFFLPPKGTKLGDSYEGNALIGYHFISPEGEDRGIAELHVVPTEIGLKIMKKIDELMKKIK